MQQRAEDHQGEQREEHTKWTAAPLSIFCSGLFVFICCRGTACLHTYVINFIKIMYSFSKKKKLYSLALKLLSFIVFTQV